MSEEKGFLSNLVNTTKSFFQPTIQATSSPIKREEKSLPVNDNPLPIGNKDPNLEGLIIALQKFRDNDVDDFLTKKRFSKLRELLKKFNE